MLKDFSKTKSRITANYPTAPVYIYQFDVTEKMLEEAEKRIVAKVKELESYKNLSDDEIPPCSKSERWTQDEKWAVMKEGRKTAVRLFDNETDAENLAKELGKGHSVEYRRGVDRKCEEYCMCCEHCSYYKQTHGL